MEAKTYKLEAFKTFFEEWYEPDEVARILTEISERMALWCTYTDGNGGEYSELRESIIFIQLLREAFLSTNKQEL